MYLEYPTTVLLALSHLTAVIAIANRYGRTPLIQKLVTPRSAIIQLAIAALALAVDRTFGIPLHPTIPFAIYLLSLQTTLILTL